MDVLRQVVFGRERFVIEIAFKRSNVEMIPGSK